MLWLGSLALAAPPAPVLAEKGSAVAIGAAFEARADALVDPDCGGDDACDALRRRTRTGGLLEGQATPWLGGWIAIAREEEINAAALFADSGLVFDGGAWLNLRPSSDAGVLAWAMATAGSAGADAGSHAERWQVETGGAARFGRPDDGFIAWVGGNLLVVGSDTTFIDGGTVEIPLQPLLPLEAVGGATVYSNPLGGYGTRSRLSFSIDAGIGARSGVGASLALVL